MIQELEAPLMALTSCNQFILWRFVDKGGPKPDKVPFDPRITDPKLQNINPHDPLCWLSYQDASNLAKQYQLGIGFVITENDPFFCVDLDGQKEPDGSWSKWSQEMCGFYAGAGIEISCSGAGLHIFGKANPLPPEHKVKSKQIPGLEVYTRNRFIALGYGSVGDASLDFTNQLNATITAVGGTKDNNAGIGWTNEAVDEYGGTDDDAELIRKMLSSGRKPSAVEAFDGVKSTKATVQDLWYRNVEKLSVAFPTETAGQDFNGSSADQALCNHLAFWTGKNCDRMDRLFRMSGIFRPEKWDRDGYNKKGYLVSTIQEANRVTKDVYKAPDTRKATQQVQHDGVEPLKPDTMIQYRQGFQFLTIDEQAQHFEGCYYVQEIHRAWTPEGILLSAEQFKAVYGGYEFAIDQNGKTTKCAWEAFTQSRIAHFPKVYGLCFRPELIPGEVIEQEGLKYINTYVPPNVKLINGSPEPFLTHLGKLLPDERDRTILLSFMAAMVQNPGKKFRWAPVIQGVEGNGKSTIVNIMSKAVGERYTHIANASEIASKFNGWMRNKLLIGCDEVHFKGNQDIQDMLKKWITDERVEMQAKGQDQVTGDNRANWIFTTNPRDAVIKGCNDRRYSIFFSAQQRKSDLVRDGMNSNYFLNLYKWLEIEDGYAIITLFLKNYMIPEEFNPAGLCQTAPNTSSTAAAIRESYGRAEQEIIAAVEDRRQGFKDGWLSSIKVKEILETNRINLTRSKLNNILDSLGYIPHPNLKDGKSPQYLFEEGQSERPVLYCLNGSELENIPTEQVIQQYKVMQGYC